MTAIQDAALAFAQAVEAAIEAAIAAGAPPVVVPPVVTPPVVAPPVVVPDTVSVTVGPPGSGADYEHITTAMQALMVAHWIDGNGTQLPNPVPIVVTLLPAPDGYYDRDCGVGSARWADTPAIRNLWPRWEQALFGPVTIQGLAGHPPPVLSTLGGDAALTTAVYYSKGFFILDDHGYTFRNVVFRGLRGLDGGRELSGLRGEAIDAAASPRTWLFEDVWFDDCNTGFLGGSPGQQITFRRCRFSRCGDPTGDRAGFTHNAYVGEAGSAARPVILEDCLSTDAYIGHLFKCRSHLTIRGTVRLIGDGGAGTDPCTASYCLDLPQAGTFTVEKGAHLILAMAEKASNGILLHYSGENKNFLMPAEIIIDGKLTMIGNSTMTWTNVYGTTYPIVGMRDDSGFGDAVSGTGSRPATVRVNGTVEVWNIPAGAEGFPAVTRLAARPTLDLSSPCLTTAPRP